MAAICPGSAGESQRRLNTDYWSTTSETSHSFYVGSYGRSTAIHGTSDVDMIFWLPYAVYKDHSSVECMKDA